MRILSDYIQKHYNYRDYKHSFRNFGQRKVYNPHGESNAGNISDNDAKNKHKMLLLAGAVALSVFSFAKMYPHLSIKISAHKIKSKAMTQLKELYADTIRKYPEDETYYKQLALSLGLKSGEEYKLASVVGKSQLTDLLSKYTASDFYLGDNLNGVKNLTYRVNLHNHTVHSDGKMTVKQLLEQSRKWADNLANFRKNDRKPPFVVAITDHDTLDGAQEALKILVSEPEKYKNLKLVLGSEASMSYVNPADVKVPLNLELVGYGLNPFNSMLNDMFAELRAARIDNAKKIIDEINSVYPDLRLNWEEASNFHPNLARGTSDGSIWLLRQYALFKAALKKYCAIKGNLIPDELILPLSSDFLKKVALKMIADGDVESYFRTIKYGELTNIPSFKLENSIKNTLTGIRDKYVYNTSALLERKVILTPQTFFENYNKSQDNGFWGLAHPGFLNTSMFSDEIKNYCMKHSKQDEGHHLAWRLFKHLKDVGGNKFAAYEANYQFYGSEPERLQWTKKMNALGELPRFHLLRTGGADCHETSIFHKHEKLTPKKIAELNLCKIVEQ